MPKEQKSVFPSDAAEKFMLRLPDGMRDRIADAAKANSRSMNAEVVARLAASFEPPALGFGPGSVGDQFEKARQEVMAKMEASVPDLADKVWKLVDERMKAEKK